MTAEVQVNDCLGLCQYVTKHLEDQQAVRYLLSVESLTYEDWRRAKDTLPGTCVTNKTTIEGNIKEIITVLYNQEIKTRYLVGNLGILPGLNEESLRLMSFVNSTLEAVKQNVVFEVQKQTVNNIASQIATTSQSTSSAGTSLAAQGIPPTTQPSFSDLFKGLVQPPKPPRRTRKQPWTYGKDFSSEHANQTPQLKFACLAVKSGPEETEETLKSELNKWSSLRKVEVKAVSQSHMSNTFRVQFETPASMVKKWTEESTWPDRMAVKPWKGNPRQTLKLLLFL